MSIKDAAYRAETLHYLRRDYRLAASRLPADIKPIWEDVLLSIEYGQSLRDQWPLITKSSGMLPPLGGRGIGAPPQAEALDALNEYAHVMRHEADTANPAVPKPRTSRCA
jgi:hypothetical protein